jgi:hypothetical protein
VKRKNLRIGRTCQQVASYVRVGLLLIFIRFLSFFLFLDFSLFNMCLDSDRSVNIFLALDIM